MWFCSDMADAFKEDSENRKKEKERLKRIEDFKARLEPTANTTEGEKIAIRKKLEKLQNKE